MATETGIDEQAGRKYYLDVPEDAERGDLTFVLNIHGGGSAGVWQRSYFPAHDHVDTHGLVVAAPTAKTAEPMRHWVKDADDEHLRTIAADVLARFGDRIRSFWLAGHSQGGITASRLLGRDDYFADRVDGFLSLSGGRLGQAQVVPDFGPPRTEEERKAMAERMATMRRGVPPIPEAEFSFIFAVGEHEIVSLPETSPWAERFGAGPRERQPDVIDEQPGRIHDSRWDGNATLSWGREPRPGRAEVWVYPGGRDGRVIADVVRIDKGHTEGLEPEITRTLVEMIVDAPGGKTR